MKRCIILALALASGLEGPASNAADLVVEGWHHRVWSVYPVEKIKATEELPVGPKVGTVELSAARGGHESLVLVVRPDVPLREVSVEVVGFPVGLKVSVQRLGYVYVDEPSGSRIKQPMPYPTGTGLFPDPLLENKGDVRPYHNLQFLVTVEVPREAKPGNCEGVLKLRYRRETWMPAVHAAEDIVPVRLRVRSFALPEHSPLYNTSFANLRVLPEAQRSPERVAAFQRTFVDHQQTPEPLVPSPTVKLDKEGVLSVDSTSWEQAVAELFEQGGTHVFVPVWDFYPLPSHAQGLYFLYHYPAVTGQKWFGARICAEDKTLTPEFKSLFGAYLAHMHQVLKRRGWLDRAFITTMDEPYTYHTGDREKDVPANNYEVVRNFVAFVRQVAPGLRTFATADPVEGLVGSIDHWCLRNLDHAAAARERAEKHGEVVTFCDNYRTFIDYPAISARSLGWLAWRIGARGWLTYETLGSYPTAWEAPVLVYAQFNGATVWGMGQMFYPHPLSGAPLPSLRWELMRTGCEDYEHLWLLKKALQVKPNAEAQQLLDTAAAAIVGGSGDAEATTTITNANAVSNQTAHSLRERLADWIERLAAP